MLSSSLGINRQNDIKNVCNCPIVGFTKENGKFFLSNSYASTITFEGKLYPTIEHAYQAAKTLDNATRDVIKSSRIAEVKKLGRSIKLRDDWFEIRLSLMKSLIKEKFQNPFIKQLLKDTGDKNLINETKNDKFWGVVKGKGENWLGRLLQEVRDEINTEDAEIESIFQNVK